MKSSVYDPVFSRLGLILNMPEEGGPLLCILDAERDEPLQLLSLHADRYPGYQVVVKHEKGTSVVTLALWEGAMGIFVEGEAGPREGNAVEFTNARIHEVTGYNATHTAALFARQPAIAA